MIHRISNLWPLERRAATHRLRTTEFKDPIYKAKLSPNLQPHLEITWTKCNYSTSPIITIFPKLFLSKSWYTHILDVTFHVEVKGWRLFSLDKVKHTHKTRSSAFPTLGVCNYKITYGVALCSCIYSKHWCWSTLSGTVLQKFPVLVHEGSGLAKSRTNYHHKAKEQVF